MPTVKLQTPVQYRGVQCTVHLYTGGTLDHRDHQWWRSYQGENMTQARDYNSDYFGLALDIK